MIVDVLHGICMCDKEWIKPEHRVHQHLARFSDGQRCPDCGHLIDWYAVSEGKDGKMRLEE